MDGQNTAATAYAYVSMGWLASAGTNKLLRLKLTLNHPHGQHVSQ
jgi:hypothetical protein